MQQPKSQVCVYLHSVQKQDSGQSFLLWHKMQSTLVLEHVLHVTALPPTLACMSQDVQQQ